VFQKRYNIGFDDHNIEVRRFYVLERSLVKGADNTILACMVIWRRFYLALASLLKILSLKDDGI
jgi:hypothetical protein